jgi:hypothetical protein
MNTEIQSRQHSLYETDFLRWIETTVTQLQQREFAKVDWENLIEEMESMGRSERRRILSNTVILFLHLLKWQYQPSHRSSSWKSSIVEHRQRIRDDLEDSPSLRPHLEKNLDRCYRDAIDRACIETGLPQNSFPETCPYTILEILDTNFPAE